jgi:hypothetical protein
MIETAEEFCRLRTSDDPAEYQRAAHDEAPEAVWREVVVRFPEMRFWVAHNKTVPLSILETLVDDPDGRVRFMVASKRTLPERLQLQLARDADEGVRRALAANAKATPRTLGLLATDAIAEIRDKATARLAATEDTTV